MAEAEVGKEAGDRPWSGSIVMASCLAGFSGDDQGEPSFLGMANSPNIVRAPEGGGCAERFIRTLKEQLLWARAFAAMPDSARFQII